MKLEKCTKHPTYQAKRKPRKPCEDCWKYYILTQEKDSYKEMPIPEDYQQWSEGIRNRGTWK